MSIPPFILQLEHFGGDYRFAGDIFYQADDLLTIVCVLPRYALVYSRASSEDIEVSC